MGFLVKRGRELLLSVCVSFLLQCVFRYEFTCVFCCNRIWESPLACYGGALGLWWTGSERSGTCGQAMRKTYSAWRHSVSWGGPCSTWRTRWRRKWAWTYPQSHCACTLASMGGWPLWSSTCLATKTLWTSSSSPTVHQVKTLQFPQLYGICL
jgi:hypothetical protein